MTGSRSISGDGGLVERAALVPQVGKQLKDMTDEVIRLGTQLLETLDSPLASSIAKALEAVRRQRSRIAVLGQIKAGKSSFLNALIGRPGFLPTDVNPWTSVITNLHFAVPGQPLQGAHFQFFNETEWRQLGERADTLRELAGRLVPGHEQAEYLKHLEQLHRRAEVRLGRYYSHLFGKARWYSEVTADIVERYVCLGQHIEQPTSELVPGRYADITKKADIFFGAGHFAAPVTLIDTPGTNDPLLIRDEITMSGIKEADVFVVVLTGRQPLSSADLTLLRMLHGLQKSRIIVFINRLDELPNISLQSDRIVAAVRTVLKREFPAVDIPIVIGSAKWANAALTGEVSELEQLWEAELGTYARRRMPQLIPISTSAGSQALNSIRGRLPEVLFGCSGVPTAMAQISSLLMRSANGFWVTELASTLLAVAEVTTSSCRIELTAIEKAVGASEEPAPLADHLSRVAKLVEQLRTIKGEIEACSARAQNLIQEEVTKATRSLRVELEGQVRSFASKQGQAVREAWQTRRATRSWQCDGWQLRNSLEADVVRMVRKVDSLLETVQRNSIPELHELLRKAVLDTNTALTTVPVMQFNLSPTLSPLSRAVVFDLDDSWWALWWGRGQSAEENARKIEELVIGEFGPVAADLSGLVEADLQKLALAATRSFFTRALDVVHAAIDREEESIATTRELLSYAQDASRGTQQQRHRSLELRKRLANGEALVAGIKACIKRYVNSNGNLE